MREQNPSPNTRHDLALPAKALPGRFADAARMPPPSGGGITPSFVLQSLARWWPIALPAAAVLGGTAALIAWLVFKPTFEAESWIRIEDRRPYVAFPSQEESKRFVQTQVETIRSPVILGQCLKLSDIAQLPEVKAEIDPIKWVGKWLTITSVADSRSCGQDCERGHRHVSKAPLEPSQPGGAKDDRRIGPAEVGARA